MDLPPDPEAVVPWDRAEPNALLVEWVEREGPPTSARTIVVGAGYGRDAEYLSSLGYPTTAFDISPSAVEQTPAPVWAAPPPSKETPWLTS